MPWLALSHTITPGSPPLKREFDTGRLRQLVYTVAFGAFGVLGAAAAVSSLTSAGPAETAALLPAVTASLVPSAAVFYYLSSKVEAPRFYASSVGGALVVAVYGIAVAVTSPSPVEQLDASGVLYAAATEEVVKLGAVAAFVYAADRMRPHEAAALGASVGLGFAGVENLVYLLNSAEPGLAALDRSAVAPLHVLTTAAAAAAFVAVPPRWGDRLGFGSLPRRTRHAAALAASTAAAVAVASFLHSLYNLGVLGFLHPVLVDGAGYAAFAAAFYLAAFATAELLRYRASPEVAGSGEPCVLED